MYKYEVGQVIPAFVGHQECTVFDIADDGATMLYFYNRPTTDEITQFESEKPFEIRFTTMRGIIFVTAKVGNLSWADMAYTPHLSKNLTTLQIPNDGQGLALVLYLIDSSNGQLKHIRLLGLSEKFTRALMGEALELKMQPFSKAAYDQQLDYIYSAYSTKQIAQMSKEYCKFGG